MHTYQEPNRHYQLLPGGALKLVEGRRPSMRFLASASEVKGGSGGIVGKEARLFDDLWAASSADLNGRLLGGWRHLDERAQHTQPVANRLGRRFYDWQLAQSTEESWRECHLHARNLLGEAGYRRVLAEIEAERCAALGVAAGVRRRHRASPARPHRSRMSSHRTSA